MPLIHSFTHLFTHTLLPCKKLADSLGAIWSSFLGSWPKTLWLLDHLITGTFDQHITRYFDQRTLQSMDSPLQQEPAHWTTVGFLSNKPQVPNRRLYLVQPTQGDIPVAPRRSRGPCEDSEGRARWCRPPWQLLSSGRPAAGWSPPVPHGCSWRRCTVAGSLWCCYL